MRLQAKYNRAVTTVTVFVLLLACVGYYFLITYILILQLDETLKVEETEILDHIHKYRSLPEATSYKDQRIRFRKINGPEPRRFISTGIFDPQENKTISSRELVFSKKIDNQYYRVEVSKSQEETEDLVTLILIPTVSVILLLLIVLFILNRYLLKKLWTPFYGTLHNMESFDLTRPAKISSAPTDIDEFNELNHAVDKMTGKVLYDYQSLKKFADNASHEIQTPLAIIQSKLDVLIQDALLNEKHLQQLQSIYDSVNRLSRINHALLLLTKIENNHFAIYQSVAFHSLIKEKLFQLEEILQSERITVTTRLDELRVQIHPHLAEVLINNLLANAIRHNKRKGEIRIVTANNELAISNSGSPEPLLPADLFTRFHKSEKSDGMGLGLAIVKQICDQYGFPLAYDYSDHQHHFTISF